MVSGYVFLFKSEFLWRALCPFKVNSSNFESLCIVIHFQRERLMYLLKHRKCFFGHKLEIETFLKIYDLFLYNIFGLKFIFLNIWFYLLKNYTGNGKKEEKESMWILNFYSSVLNILYSIYLEKKKKFNKHAFLSRLIIYVIITDFKMYFT